MNRFNRNRIIIFVLLLFIFAVRIVFWRWNEIVEKVEGEPRPATRCRQKLDEEESFRVIFPLFVEALWLNEQNIDSVNRFCQRYEDARWQYSFLRNNPYPYIAVKSVIKHCLDFEGHCAGDTLHFLDGFQNNSGDMLVNGHLYEGYMKSLDEALVAHYSEGLVDSYNLYHSQGELACHWENDVFNFFDEAGTPMSKDDFKGQYEETYDKIKLSLYYACLCREKYEELHECLQRGDTIDWAKAHEVIRKKTIDDR